MEPPSDKVDFPLFVVAPMTGRSYSIPDRCTSMIRARLAIPMLMIVAVACRSIRAEEPSTLWGKTLDGWIAALREKTGQDRRTAVIAVGHFGQAANAAAPDLIELVHKGQFQKEAVDALVQIGAGVEVTVPALIEQFVQAGCLHLTGAGAIGFNRDPRDSLVQIGGPAVPALIGVLTGPNVDMRVCAAEALGMIGPSASAAVPALSRALAVDRPASDPPLLKAAVKALGRIGADAKIVVPLLNGLLDKVRGGEQEEATVSYFADELIKALVKFGALPVERLMKDFLQDGGDAYYLTLLGPGSKPVVPWLRLALKDPRAQVRIDAAIALARIDPSGGEAIPVLIDALDHPIHNDKIAYDGVPAALGHIGPAAKGAIPVLKGLMGKPAGVFFRSEIVRTLVQADPEGRESIPALISALRDEDSSVAQTAIEGLGLLGPRAKDAASALAALIIHNLTDPEPKDYDNRRAIKVLHRLDTTGTFAIPALMAVLEHQGGKRKNEEQGGLDRDDGDPVETAALLLGSYGAKAKAAIPALIGALTTQEQDDANRTVRRSAALALGQIGPDAKAAIPVLHEILKEKPCSIWDGVVIALYHLDPAGRALAEKWVQSSRDSSKPNSLHDYLGRRENVLGAMGRTSLEADILTKRRLKWLQYNLAIDPGEDWEPPTYIEEYLESIGRLGAGARLAIPQLEDLCRHRNSWVRLWASEALEKLRSAKS